MLYALEGSALPIIQHQFSQVKTYDILITFIIQEVYWIIILIHSKQKRKQICNLVAFLDTLTDMVLYYFFLPQWCRLVLYVWKTNFSISFSDTENAISVYVTDIHLNFCFPKCNDLIILDFQNWIKAMSQTYPSKLIFLP